MPEAKEIAAHPIFKGTIQDVGGPTANMYGFECSNKYEEGCCTEKQCLSPKVCSGLPVNHGAQISLLKELREIEGIKKVVLASGIC